MWTSCWLMSFSLQILANFAIVPIRVAKVRGPWCTMGSKKNGNCREMWNSGVLSKWSSKQLRDWIAILMEDNKMWKNLIFQFSHHHLKILWRGNRLLARDVGLKGEVSKWWLIICHGLSVLKLYAFLCWMSIENYPCEKCSFMWWEYGWITVSETPYKFITFDYLSTPANWKRNLFLFTSMELDLSGRGCV